MIQKLKEKLSLADIECNVAQCEKLYNYMEHVLRWNEHVNLTAITDREEFIGKHFVDSLLGSKLEEMRGAENIIDVGTGGGFPGVPLAILFPEKNFVLVDSLKKRLNIIAEISAEMEVGNVEVLHGRAEDIGRSQEHREHYDICVSRAVANLSVLAELCLPLVKVGGYFLPYKTSNNQEEIVESRNAIEALGGKWAGEKSFSNSKLKFERNILIIKKVSETDKKYPRKAGVPAKNPIK